MKQLTRKEFSKCMLYTYDTGMERILLFVFWLSALLFVILFATLLLATGLPIDRESVTSSVVITFLLALWTGVAAFLIKRKKISDAYRECIEHGSDYYFITPNVRFTKYFYGNRFSVTVDVFSRQEGRLRDYANQIETLWDEHISGQISSREPMELEPLTALLPKAEESSYFRTRAEYPKGHALRNTVRRAVVITNEEGPTKVYVLKE